MAGRAGRGPKARWGRLGTRGGVETHPLTQVDLEPASESVHLPRPLEREAQLVDLTQQVR